MPAQKAKRNKTIDISVENGREYLDRCAEITQRQADLSAVMDKTILGDTFSVLALLPQNSVDLVIADPPYNLTKAYHGSTFSRKSKEEYAAYTRKWLEPAVALLKSSGSIYICCDWESSLIIGDVLSEYLTVRNRITWQREKGRGAKANWKNGMEDIWFATKSSSYTFNLDQVKIRRKVVAPYKVDGRPKDWLETENGNYRDTCPSNFWDDITIPFWSMAENTEHPTQKSEKLMAKIILASSNPADIVLDPFLGSGTTSVTAKKLDRHYIGVEMNPLYCVWAEKRLEMCETDSDIQGYADGVFWERNSLAAQKTAEETSDAKS